MASGITNSQDAFGHLIRDWHNGIRCIELIERDDGLIAPSSGPAFYFQPFSEWSEPTREAMKYVRGRVIDVGCGAGRHCLYLQEQGFDVLGVDVSPRAVEICRARGVLRTEVCSITQLSRRMGTFETILLMGGNLGLLGSYQRARWLLRRFRSLTTDRGRIIANTADPYQTDLREHLEYHQFNRQRGRMSGQVRIRVRYLKYKTPWFDYLRVSIDELGNILEGTGWAIKEILHGENGQYNVIIDKE